MLKLNKLELMKDLNNKFGFTLAELLLAIGIIGICTALALTTIKPAEKKATKYSYMNAYNSVQKAYYNALLLGKDNAGNPLSPFTTEPDASGQSPIHTDSEDTGAKILCRGLTMFINTATNKKDANQDYSTTCSSTKITSIEADDFSEDKVQFVASNGMKFYTSRLIEGAGKLRFFIVFVDINGNRKPNSIEYTYKHTFVESEKTAEKNKVLPDIYAFAILDSGRICPIGIPEYDENVLTARFAYFKENGDPLYTHESHAYYQAKGLAWGYYSAGGPDLTKYNPDEQHTMNDAVRATIGSSSLILKDFPDLASLDPMPVQSGAPYNCSNDEIESCYIFLDEYKY